MLYFLDRGLLILQTKYPTLWWFIYRRKTFLWLIFLSFALLVWQIAWLWFTDFFNELIEKSSSNSEKFFYKLLDIYFWGSWEFIFIFLFLTIIFVVWKIFEDQWAFSKKIFTWSFFQDKYNENLNSSVRNKYIPELHTDNQLSEIIIRILWWERFRQIFEHELENQQVVMYKEVFEEDINNLLNVDVDKEFFEIQNKFRELSKWKENIFDNLLNKIFKLKENFINWEYECCKSLKDEITEDFWSLTNYYDDYKNLFDKLIKPNENLRYYGIDKEEFKRENTLSESEYKIEIEKRERNSNILSKPLFSMSEYAVTSIEKLFYLFNYLDSQELHISWSAWAWKTHTLFNIYETVIKSEHPAIFILWQNLIKNELFEIQIKELLDIPNNITLDDFLSLLNKQWELYKCKIPIIIDGLNESVNWKNIFTNISSFVAKIKKFSNLVLITTYRSNYEDEIFKGYALKNWGYNKYWNKYILHWFTWDFDLLLDKYFKYYSITVQNNFNKYLFEDKLVYLKMFCEVNQWKEISINTLSFSGIFEKYITKCNDEICIRLDKPLNLNKAYSNNKLNNLWKELWNGNLRLVWLNEVIPSIFSNDIELNHFLNEDLLFYKNLNSPNSEWIWFTYDLFWGYIIAKLILEENKIDIEEFLRSNNFKEKILEKKHPLFDDILECLILLLLKEKICIFEYLESDLVNEKLIEIIHDLEKEFLIENKEKILPFLEREFKWNYKNQILDKYLENPLDINYPINTNFWHSILLDFSLSDRDGIFTIKISNHYKINDWIDELRSKMNELKNKYKDWEEKLLLIWKFFSWFLSTTNNKARDKITKLLVELLTDKPISYLKLLENFIDVNDPYIFQRILAIWLWVTVRSDSSKGIKNLVDFIYEYFYLKKNIPIDILSRDYIKTIVEYWYKKLWLTHIDLDTIKYPYSSEFDIESIPTFEELEKYSDIIYSGKDWYHDYVWSSVMYSQWSLADFWRYILGSNVSNWLNINIKASKIPVLEELEEEFNDSLSKELLKEYKEFQKIEKKEELGRIYEMLIGTCDKKEYKSDKLKREFIKKLNDKQLKFYARLNDFKDKAWAFWDINWFDTKIAERWIYDRVIKLWYDINKHWDFDNRIWRNYHDRWWNSIERIWKKYQWIALHELLGRISDNFKFRDDRSSNKEASFKSPQTIYVRDIDATYISRSNEWWWFDEGLENYLYTDISNKDFIVNSDSLDLWEWIKSESWIPNYKELIERKDDKGTEWITLEWFFSITEKTDKDDIESNWKKQFWNQLRSYMVKKEDSLSLKDWLWDKNFMWRSLMPESSDNHYSYLWEWYWSEWYDELHIPYYWYEEWTNNYGKLPKDILVTVENYYSERKWDDIEWYWNTRILLLSRYIAEKLWAKWDDKKSAIVDESWEIIWFNPILYWVKENSLFVRKDVFLRFLDDNALEVIFTVLWEKLILWRTNNDRNIINWVYHFNESNNLEWDFTTKIEI